MNNNIFEGIPDEIKAEVFDTIFRSKDLSIERIISRGQSTPSGQWLSQDRNEWVILLQGGAVLVFADTSRRCVMRPGDHVYIDKGRRHRVEITVKNEISIWLAVHF